MTTTIKESLTFGWSTFKARPWFFVGAVALFAVLSVVVSTISSAVTGPVASATFFNHLLGFTLTTLLNVAMGAGFTYLMLKAHDSVMSPTYKDLWQPSFFLKYLGAYLIIMAISAIAVLVPTMAIVTGFLGSGAVSGILVMVLLGPIILLVASIISLIISPFISFVLLLVVDRKLGPVAAVKENFRIGKKHWGKIVLLFLTVAVVNLLGAIALVIGLVVTVPVSLLATIHLYRGLVGTQAEPPAPVYTSEPAPVA